MPEQLTLPGLSLRQDKPMLHLETAIDLLGRSEDEITTLIEEGRLSHAWDIRSKRSERAEIRIWRVSLLDYYQGRVTPTFRDDDVVSQVIGHGRATITGPEAQRILSCSQWLVRNLAREEQIVALNTPAAGPGNALKIDRDSFARFLISRLNRL